MWGFLIGLYIALIIYPYLQEWQQRRANKASLAKMRKHHAAGHQWDVRKMLWGGGADIASIAADVNRWSTPCRS
jgi:hypothetical protein